MSEQGHSSFCGEDVPTTMRDGDLVCVESRTRLIADENQGTLLALDLRCIEPAVLRRVTETSEDVEAFKADLEAADKITRTIVLALDSALSLADGMARTALAAKLLGSG